MLLITGATGTVGTEVVKQLAGTGTPARAMVRNPSKVTAQAGIDLVAGDFTDATSIDRALDGIETAFLLPPLTQDVVDLQKSFIDAAKRAGVKKIVKLSAIGSVPDSPVILLRHHAVGDDYLKESGIAYTILQPNGFMQNILGSAGTIAGQGAIYAPAADAQISHIDVRDIAAVAVRTLTELGHDGQTYLITGPAAITYTEMAEAISAAVGKQVTYVNITPEQFKDAMTSVGAPGWMADALNELYALYRDGGGSPVTDNVQKLTGRPATSFAQFAKDYASVLKGS